MDAALLRAFRGGDPGALERVYRAHVGDVEALLRRALFRIGRLTPANLADLVQDVFVRAFSEPARASYDGLREYAPYLSTIARNVFIDWARRSGRELPGAQAEGAAEAAAAAALGGAGTSGEEVVFGAALVALAHDYVESLSVELRAIHHQRFVLAMPQRQAAEALGISRQTLRTREKKLLSGLRRALRKAGVAAPPLPAPGAAAAPAAKKPNPASTERRMEGGAETDARRP